MRPLLVGFSVRAIAQSAARAGAQPVAVDYFGDRDLTAVCPAAIALGRAGLPYAAATLVAIADKLSWDAVAYTGGLENHPDVVGALAKRAPLLGNPPDVLAAVRDWRQVSAALAQAGYRVPVTLPAGAAVPAEGVWLAKPVAGSGGAGIAVAAPGSSGTGISVATPGRGGTGIAPARPGTAPPPGGTRLIQEAVAGTPGSALFVADGSRSRLLGVTELLSARPAFGGGAFQYAGNILLPAVPPALKSRLERLCQCLTARYGLVGLNGVDFICDDADPIPLEVNPRYTAAMELVEAASGASLFALHAAACAGRGPAALRPWQGYFGKAVIYGNRPGTWRFAGDWAAAAIADVPFPGDPVAAGRPICTVLAQGVTRAGCLAQLEARAAWVREECLDG